MLSTRANLCASCGFELYPARIARNEAVCALLLGVACGAGVMIEWLVYQQFPPWRSLVVTAMAVVAVICARGLILRTWGVRI